MKIELATDRRLIIAAAKATLKNKGLKSATEPQNQCFFSLTIMRINARLVCGVSFFNKT